MSHRLNLPDSASIATPRIDGRLHAPSAARNATAVCDLVKLHAPQNGKALELASGTGQHIVELAKTLPGIDWQPTEIDATRRASIDIRVREAELSNLSPSILLNATTLGWSEVYPNNNLILLVNLLHLISATGAKTLICEAAQALAPEGCLVLYGPFLRDGKTTSEGDAKFHASLCEHDEAIGYKNDWDVIDWLHQVYLDLVQVVEMPANNLAFVAKRGW